jgi:hypothetical protein
MLAFGKGLGHSLEHGNLLGAVLEVGEVPGKGTARFQQLTHLAEVERHGFAYRL